MAAKKTNKSNNHNIPKEIYFPISEHGEIDFAYGYDGTEALFDDHSMEAGGRLEVATYTLASVKSFTMKIVEE